MVDDIARRVAREATDWNSIMVDWRDIIRDFEALKALPSLLVEDTKNYARKEAGLSSYIADVEKKKDEVRELNEKKGRLESTLTHLIGLGAKKRGPFKNDLARRQFEGYEAELREVRIKIYNKTREEGETEAKVRSKEQELAAYSFASNGQSIFGFLSKMLALIKDLEIKFADFKRYDRDLAFEAAACAEEVGKARQLALRKMKLFYPFKYAVQLGNNLEKFVNAQLNALRLMKATIVEAVRKLKLIDFNVTSEQKKKLVLKEFKELGNVGLALANEVERRINLTKSMDTLLQMLKEDIRKTMHGVNYPPGRLPPNFKKNMEEFLNKVMGQDPL